MIPSHHKHNDLVHTGLGSDFLAVHQQAQQVPAQSQAVPQQQQQQQVLDPNDPLSSNGNIFNDTISPFFAPYGIDVSHFPLTNPPIFESALYNVDSDSEPRSRRRISISNGQIGQIITTHTLNNDDLYDIQPPPYPKTYSTQTSQHLNLDVGNRVRPPQQTNNTANANGGNNNIVIHSGATTQQQQPLLSSLISNTNKSSNTDPQQPYTTNNQGIPNEKLIYNNEIIFNPDAGPIPGTAAWKKARLLERNRIAASKCRQRKKAAQIQLKEDIANYEKEIEKLEMKNHALMELFELVKKNYSEDDEVKKTLSNIELLMLDDE